MWKDITEFENRYQINEAGQIRNVNTMRILSSTVDSDGYMQIGLRKLGIRKKHWFRVHRLIAISFLPLPENYQLLHVDHIDRNKLNNVLENLRWVTPQENCDNRKDTAWNTNTTSGELHITKYKNGYMLRINKHNLKHKSWHKTLEESILKREEILDLA
jgi:hypothetical protein